MDALAFGVGTRELLLIAFIVLILFGATRLPKLASSVGQSYRNFKRGLREAQDEEDALKSTETNQTQIKNNTNTQVQSASESTSAADAAPHVAPKNDHHESNHTHT